MVRLAVDVCIGPRGIKVLEDAGHDVVVTAEHAESDESWFARALAANADAVIAIDRDLEILCHDADVPLVKPRYGLTDRENARRALPRLAKIRGRLAQRDAVVRNDK